MKGDPLKIMRMREGGHVQRCHCFPHIGTYDVAQHTFHMLLLMEELHPDPPKHLYSLILRHDLLERWTGDIPATATQLVPEIRELKTRAENQVKAVTGIEDWLGDEPVDDYDIAWLKGLDNLEFLLWCDDQEAMGNLIATRKKRDVMDSLQSDWEKIPPEIRSFIEDRGEWKRTTDLPS